MSSEVNQPIRPPSHKSFQLGSVKFSSEFDSGNLSFVEKASSMAYDIWIGTDHPENNYRTWFYFWFEGVGRGSTVTFNVKNMHNQTRLLSEGLVPVYRNEGSTSWRRIAHRINTLNMGFNSDGFLEFSFKHTMDTDGRVWLAFFYPWSTEDNDRLLCSLQQQARSMNDVYFHRTTLALSYQNRPIQLVTISSTSHLTKLEESIEDKVLFPNKVRPRMFTTAKRGIFISARVHPGEVPSSHVMNGILKGLLKDNEVARLLREKFVFYLVPIINPDGVYRGHYRTDKNGVNLNRYYINPNPKDHSPIYAIKKFILHLHNSKRFFACLDMHAHASRKGAFIYGNYSTELKKQMEICLFPKLLSLNSRNFEYEGSNFTEKNMYCKDRADSISKQGAARVALFKITKNPYCWTLECNYNMGRYQNNLCPRNQQRLTSSTPEDKFDKDLITNYQYMDQAEAKDFYTIETYENLGEEILDSFLDLIDSHPFSRVNNPNSRFRSIQNLKLNLLVALMKMVPYHFESTYRKLLLAVTSDKQELGMRAIRALHEIFIRNKQIDSIDDYLKNDPPPLKQLPKLQSSRLPAIKEPSTTLVRRKTYEEIQVPVPPSSRQPEKNDHSDDDSDESPQEALASTNETVQCTITSPNGKSKVVVKRQSTLVRSTDKQDYQVKTRLREYIQRLSYNQTGEETISMQSIPTLKVYSFVPLSVNLKMMKKTRHQQTIEMTTVGGRQPTRSLLFNKRPIEREVSSGARRASKLIADSLAAS